MGKRINRLLGLHILIQSLPGSSLRIHVKSFTKPCDSTSVLKALPGKLDIKRHSPSIYYLSSLVALACVHGSVVVESLFSVSPIVCVMVAFHPYVFVQYLVSFLDLQSSRWRRGRWMLHFNCLFDAI